MAKSSKEGPIKAAIEIPQQSKIRGDVNPNEIIKDLKRVQAEFQKDNPDEVGTVVSRNYYRVYGKYTDNCYERHFSNFNKLKVAAGLAPTQTDRKVRNAIAQDRLDEQVREFYTKEFSPWVGKYEKTGKPGRVKTILVASDFHDIDTDMFCLRVFLDTAKRVQPDVIVLNGDVFDQYSVSRFAQDVRLKKTMARMRFVWDNIFAPLRAACPNAQIDLILGNHEHRLVKFLSGMSGGVIPELFDGVGVKLKDIFGVDKYKINLISKWTMEEWVSTDRANSKFNAQLYYDFFLVQHDKPKGLPDATGTSGHLHRPAVETNVTHLRRPHVWVRTGCMCMPGADYPEHPEKWQQSFLLAHCDTENKQAVMEHVMFTDHMACVGGAYYFRNKNEQLRR